MANECCAITNCWYCGEPCLHPRQRIHPTCQDAYEFSRAVDVSETWVDRVCWNDNVYEDLEELHEELAMQIECNEIEQENLPKWVYVVVDVPFERFELDDMIERYEEHLDLDDYEFRKHAAGLRDLEAAFKRFNQQNAGRIEGWRVDYTRKVAVGEVSLEPTDG